MKNGFQFAIATTFFLLSLQEVSAQKEIIVAPQFVGISDGLVSQTVNTVLQDSFGLIWVGTDNGLQLYDGYKFQTFKSAPGKATSINHNLTWDLVEDDNHDIWVATDLGVARYDRKKNEFRNYTFGAEVGIAIGNGRSFKLLIDSQKRLWAANGAVELLRYDWTTDKWMEVKYRNALGAESGPGSMALGLAEDANGTIWIGSGRNGLMRLDKNDSLFNKVPTEIDFIDSNFITGIYCESSVNIYITTIIGVYRYNPQTNVVKPIQVYTSDLGDATSNWNSIHIDKDKNVLIGNNFRGILKLKPNSEEFEHIFFQGAPGIVGNGFNYMLTDFMIDRSGIIWMGTTGDGLIKYNPANKPFTVYTPNEKSKGSIAPNGVFGIMASKAKPGIIYTGTRGLGFQTFDQKTQLFTTHTFKSNGVRFSGFVRSFAEEPDGSLWLGTWDDGLLKLDANYNEIERYPGEGKPDGLSDRQVRILRHAPDGKLWIGTNAGLNVLDIPTRKVEVIPSISTKHYPKKLYDEIHNLMGSKNTVAIIEKAKSNSRLSQPFEIKTQGKYIVMSVGEGDASVMADFGWIENAAKETVWVDDSYKRNYHAGGAIKNRVKIDVLDLAPGAYTLHYVADASHATGSWNETPPTASSLYGVVLLSPKDENQAAEIRKLSDPMQHGIVVAGTNITDIHFGKKYTWVTSIAEGLTRIDRSTDSVKHYFYDATDDNSLSSDTGNSLYEEADGDILWIATTEGICRLEVATDKVTRYSEPEGLPTNLTGVIVPGDKNELWIGTQNGISQMLINETLNRVTFINYNSMDGLGGDNYLPLNSTKTADGQYFFGGQHGLTTFSRINADTVPPAVIISNILISNRSVLDMKESSPLTEPLLSTDHISLSFDQNNLSFEFAALHYANPKKNQLAHMLDGYDKDWIYDNRNFAAYTNLDPGTYTLKVRASNAFGTWNEEGRSITITIAPPWWRTWWAYGTYVGLFGIIALGSNNAMQKNIKRKERERSREKELQQAKEIERAYTNLKATQAQLIQSEKMASLGELTAGIAHEIQNPLNFVNNFSEINLELIEEMKGEIALGNLQDAREIAETIADNEAKIIYHGKRADGIVKGMLQHSRTSSGQKEPTDINSLADEYLRLAYHGLRAKDKSFNATLRTDFDPNLGKINVLPQDLGRVILNLITNAFHVVAEKNAEKRSGDTYEPTVSVATKRNGNKVEIRVTDNGKGIPPSIIDKIFQPFFTTKPSGQGTGLGLSLSYEIVTKGHGGELTVETEEGKGSTFIINIPA